MLRHMQDRIAHQNLTDYFASGCKPAERWRIGTEHEKIGFCTETLRPIPYEGKKSIRALLEKLATDDWQLSYENEFPIALWRGDASITLEPGGQLELSGAPLSSIHATCRETSEHLASLRRVADELGIAFLGLGFQPLWQQQDIPWMPKQRYALMKEYMPKVGAHGLDMMLRTATVQANLDYASEADMAKKMRVAACLQPLVTALFAASPFVDGKPSGYLSWRSRCWEDTDPARTGIPAFIFKDKFGFEDYAEWALDAPMYFVIRDKHYINCSGESFRDFLDGKLASLPGERPTMADWELHLSTLFPDVRLKSYLEMRGADSGAWPWICALPALWKGLLYDEASLEAAWSMVESWTHTEVLTLRHVIPKQALTTAFRDTTVRALCHRMLEIAKAGLERLDTYDTSETNESKFLAPLERSVETGLTQADLWLAAYHGDWKEDIRRLFIEAMHP